MGPTTQKKLRQYLEVLFILSMRFEKKTHVGKDQTVIGVPKKSKVTAKLLPFEELPVDIGHYEMLRWFVDDGITKSAVYENKFVHEKDIEIIPERVTNAIIDKTIVINEIKCYLTEGSWLAIQEVIKMKKLTPTWIYTICAKDAK
ncbi:hypothetical protein QTP88_028616 [Uroleucon formosanum]